jgi:hypothetical protein
MPAAGKCRKGVFMLKKLLLVMLVPVLVLGFLGCSSSLETGNETPFVLHGTWVNIDDDPETLPYFIVTSNEITIIVPVAGEGVEDIQVAFRSEFSGTQWNFLTEGNQVATFGLTRIVDGVDFGSFSGTVSVVGEILFMEISDNQLNLGGDGPWYENTDLIIAGEYVKVVPGL